MLYLIAVLVSAFIAVSAQAAIPATMNYQGILTQSNGSPVNGTVSVVFRLYDVVSGGTALWQESQSVSVSNGNFSVELGTITPLTAAVFANPVFLGVTVAPDSEMTPRRPLSSVPYAFKAQDSATINGGGGFKATDNSLYKITSQGCLSMIANSGILFPNLSSLSLNSTCSTNLCSLADFFGSPALYFTCNGACQSGVPQACANTLIGVVVTPQ